MVISKARLTRIKSLKSLTIPKKELTAALSAARLTSLVNKSLKIQAKRFFWTDSMNVWHWTHGESPEKHTIFIKNRLVEILKLSKASEWSHCSGKINPADLPSRGLSMEKLKGNELRLQGPPFLKSSEHPIIETQSPSFSAMIAATTTASLEEPTVDIVRYSKLNRAIRVYATVIRAATLFKTKIPGVRKRKNSPKKSIFWSLPTGRVRTPLTPTESCSLSLSLRKLSRSATTLKLGTLEFRVLDDAGCLVGQQLFADKK